MGSMTPVEAAWKLDALPGDTSLFVVDVHPRAPDGPLPHGFERGSVAPFPKASAAEQFVLENLGGHGCFIKLLLPAGRGYVIQSDFLSRRMVDCKDVTRVGSFVSSGQHIEARNADVYGKLGFADLLGHSIGAMAIHRSDDTSATEKSEQVNLELTRRLAFTWLAPNPTPRRRLALIGGRSLSALQGYAEAAASLNIALVILDEPTHWIAGPEWAHLREEFVPFDMTADAGMVQRIADALMQYQKGHSLDGVMTIEEHLLTTVAHAAALLGFPTSPPKSVGMAQNKYQTRQLDRNVFCRSLRCIEDVEALLAEPEEIPFPLIVKPARGWASEGVWKVLDAGDLRDKAARLWRDAFAAWHGHEVVVETYIDGPEVDANLVLVDGEVAFFEVNDDFPSAGDKSEDGKDRFANFVEVANVIPSTLPQDEMDVLQRRLHEYALAAGFRDGVFHMEARLRNSSCHFAEVEGSGGLVDLVAKTPTHGVSTRRDTDVFLLEINPRPPGMQEINATARAYGVSYYGLSLLNGLADRARMKALCQPFSGGAQYHMQILFVSAERGGVYKYGDVYRAVLERQPQLREHIVEGMSFLRDGQEVPDPTTGSMTWVAFFLLNSRTSRTEVLRLGEQIKALVREHTGGF